MTDDELRIAYQREVVGQTPASRETCPEPEALLALATGTGAEAERLSVLNHAMACAHCHRELALLQAMHAANARAEPSVRRMARWRWRIAASLTIGLVGGAGLVARTRARAPTDDAAVDVARGGEEPGEVTLLPARMAHAGADGAPASQVDWQLAWRRVPGAVAYQVEVLDAKDRAIVSRQTAGTSVIAPVSRAVTGATWWVRATMTDGSERHSRVERLVP